MDNMNIHSRIKLCRQGIAPHASRYKTTTAWWGLGNNNSNGQVIPGCVTTGSLTPSSGVSDLAIVKAGYWTRWTIGIIWYGTFLCCVKRDEVQRQRTKSFLPRSCLVMRSLGKVSVPDQQAQGLTTTVQRTWACVDHSQVLVPDVTLPLGTSLPLCTSILHLKIGDNDSILPSRGIMWLIHWRL